MRAFRIINQVVSSELQRQFAPLTNPECDLTDFPFQARISVFDHWLSAAEALELIDHVCDSERQRRAQTWASWYEVFSASFDMYLVKYRHGRLMFKQPRSVALLNQRLCQMESAGVLSLVLPTCGCWYQQYVDDTHLVAYQSVAQIAPLKATVLAAGLHWLE